MDLNRFKSPVAVHLIWHQNDDAVVNPIITRLEKLLMRDAAHPFSRFANIPLYYYNTKNVTLEGNLDVPSAKAVVDLVIVFLSHNFIGTIDGLVYLRKMVDCSVIVPVWLEAGVGRTGVDSFDSINAIRLYDFPEVERDRWGVLLIAHEVLRRGLTTINDDDCGKVSSIKLFLSHAKADSECEKLVVRIKTMVQRTNLSQFYDKTEISPGFYFDEEIEKSIKDSTIIAFRGNEYSSRYWCQKEILLAKANDRPIVVCDMLSGYEDRGFPALSNIPSVRIANSTIDDKDVLDLLILAVRETIRCRYTTALLSIWVRINQMDCHVLSRPPEADVLLNTTVKGCVCYYDPPVFEDEIVWCKNIGIEAITPLYNPNKDANALRGLSVGVSASEPTNEGYGHSHLNRESWKLLAQDIGRHILVRAARLVYGGDMRKGGLTEFLLEEASRLRDRPEFRKGIQPIVNYLAWPIHLKEKESVKWRNNFAYLLDSQCLAPASTVADKVDAKHYIAPVTDENSFIWAICLSDMRRQMIDCCDARICIGGRSSGYRGCMPGVLEEILIALETGKPLLLLGGFGGVVGEVCDILQGNSSRTINHDWQIENTPGYAALLLRLKNAGVVVDYNKIVAQLQQVRIADLASRSGLAEEEYRMLMESEYGDECTYLVNKSLVNIKKAKGVSSNGK